MDVINVAHHADMAKQPVATAAIHLIAAAMTNAAVNTAPYPSGDYGSKVALHSINKSACKTKKKGFVFEALLFCFLTSLHKKQQKY